MFSTTNWWITQQYLEDQRVRSRQPSFEDVEHEAIRYLHRCDHIAGVQKGHKDGTAGVGQSELLRGLIVTLSCHFFCFVDGAAADS